MEEYVSDKEFVMNINSRTTYILHASSTDSDTPQHKHEIIYK